MNRTAPVIAALIAAACAAPPAGPVAPGADALADAIHARLLTLDTHKDIDPKLAPEQLPGDPATRDEFRRRYDPSVWGSQQVDFPKMRAGGLDCAFFVVYVPQRRLDPAGYRRALAEANVLFDAIHRMLRLFPETIGLARSPDEVEQLHRAGMLIACIGIENGYAMGEDLGLLVEFHRRGARYLSITHNGHSQLGDSHTPPEPLHGGLSELGRQAIAECNRLGIMIDVSHAAKSTTMQAIAASRAPVIASHSGARAVNDHSRNLDDEQLRAIARNGGVVQCVALADFLRSSAERRAAIAEWRAACGLGDDGADDEERSRRWERFQAGMPAIDAAFPRAGVADFCDHIDHIVAVAGIDHVGIGTDFDGGGGIEGFDDASQAPNVTRELVRRGYTEAQIAQIWSGNLLRVWREVERVAAAQR